MYDIEIGDIVEPISYARKSRHGVGMVVANQTNRKLPITVAFPSSTQLFAVWDFYYFDLRKAKVSAKKKQNIIAVGNVYAQIQTELSMA